MYFSFSRADLRESVMESAEKRWLVKKPDKGVLYVKELTITSLSDDSISKFISYSFLSKS